MTVRPEDLDPDTHEAYARLELKGLGSRNLPPQTREIRYMQRMMDALLDVWATMPEKRLGQVIKESIDDPNSDLWGMEDEQLLAKLSKLRTKVKFG